MNSNMRSQAKTENLKSQPNLENDESNKNDDKNKYEDYKNDDVFDNLNRNKIDYKFKPKSHSGKYSQDILLELEEKKKVVDFLAGPKNVIKYQ